LASQFGRQHRKSINLIIGPPVFDRRVLALDIASILMDRQPPTLQQAVLAEFHAGRAPSPRTFGDCASRIAISAGLTIFSKELSQKRLELFREAVPSLARVAVLINPSFPAALTEMKATEEAAQFLGIKVQSVPVSGIDELERALASLTTSNVDGLITLADPFFTAHRSRIVDLANAARLPTMLPWREFVEAGGLLSYAPDNVELYRRAASFVDKILKGAKPSDLPIEQPTKFLLAINLKTAKTLGIAVPQSVLFRADEVIE
jgi:putative tryptophan/tyrosine transport system substrate-binding protein